MLMLLRIQFMILIKEEVVADEVKEILLPRVTFEPGWRLKPGLSGPELPRNS